MAPTEITWFVSLQDELFLIDKRNHRICHFLLTCRLVNKWPRCNALHIGKRKKGKKKKQRPIDKPEEKSILKQYKQEVSLQIN